MTENALRRLIGIVLIVLHFGILGLLFTLYIMSGFRFDEFTTSVAIIMPMFSGYTVAIVIHFSRNRYVSNDTSERVTAIFSLLSLAFPLVFAIAISVSILLFAYGRSFSNFEQFKGMLTLLEAAFAAYIANFIYTLFEKQNLESEEQNV